MVGWIALDWDVGLSTDGACVAFVRVVRQGSRRHLYIVCGIGEDQILKDRDLSVRCREERPLVG
jgi:hypothetical protein